MNGHSVQPQIPSYAEPLASDASNLRSALSDLSRAKGAWALADAILPAVVAGWLPALIRFADRGGYGAGVRASLAAAYAYAVHARGVVILLAHTGLERDPVTGVERRGDTPDENWGNRLATEVPGAQLYGDDTQGTGSGVDGMGAFFLLLDDPEVYGLPPDPVDATRDLAGMWKAAAGAAGVLVLAVASAFFGRRR